MLEFNGLIDKYKKDIIKNTQELVRIPSIEEEPLENMPFGLGPYKALSYVLNLGDSLGFNVKNFDGYAGHVEYGSGDEIIGVLAHVDVVPVGDGWTMDPFCGEERCGKIYGRGSYDDKGACIASLYALNAIKESGVSINKKIRLIYGANEETGMKDIPYYLSKEKEPAMAFSPDSPFPVIYGEKGVLNFKIKQKYNNLVYLKRLEGGLSSKFVPSKCIAQFNLNNEQKEKAIKSLNEIENKYEYSYDFDSSSNILEITVFGKSAHGTRPYEGINAITGMMLYLSAIDFLDKDIEEIIKLYNSKIGNETDGKTIGCNFTDDISTPLTLNVGKVSMADNSVEFDIHIRYPIMLDYKKLIDNLSKNLSDDNVELIILDNSPPHYVPKDSDLVKKLMDIYMDFTGEKDAVPTTIEGGTYARTLKNAVGFGPLFPGEKQVAHGPDEYVIIESLIKATKIYAEVLYELSK